MHLRSQGARQAASPATENGQATSLEPEFPDWPATIRTSLVTSLVLLQDFSDLRQLLRRSVLRRERLHDQAAHGAVENAVQQIRHQFSLRLLLRHARLIYVGVRSVVPFNQSLLGHDLQELQDRRV